jgi:hypothetical protein
MQAIYRSVIIGIFATLMVAATPLLPGTGNRAQAATVIATTQPSPSVGSLPPTAEHLLGVPDYPTYNRRGSIGFAQRCIPRGQACVINGTPCCAGSCQGKFPNTSCR